MEVGEIVEFGEHDYVYLGKGSEENPFKRIYGKHKIFVLNFENGVASRGHNGSAPSLDYFIKKGTEIVKDSANN